jgi:hypothetical protein
MVVVHFTFFKTALYVGYCLPTQINDELNAESRELEAFEKTSRSAGDILLDWMVLYLLGQLLYSFLYRCSRNMQRHKYGKEAHFYF